jgi:nitroreductase
MEDDAAAAAFFSVVHRQRACRVFQPDPVDDETIGRILRAATAAPSAENGQPWVFVVVREASTRAAIGDIMRRVWQGGAKSFSETRLSPGLLADVDGGAAGGVAAAPVLIVVGADTERVHPATIAASIFPAVQNLLLAATAVGLGSALTTLAVSGSTGGGAELAALIELPPPVTPVAVIPIGRPARPLGPARRRPLPEVAYRETFGSTW